MRVSELDDIEKNALLGKVVEPEIRGAKKMSVNEDKNIGNTVVDRETEQGQWTTLDGCPITPEPWFVRAATFCDDGVVSFEVVMPGEPRMSAVDARVIGAAPALFAACKAVLERHSTKAWKRRKTDRYFDGCACDDCIEIGSALALANMPVESAKRPISDRGTNGQAS